MESLIYAFNCAAGEFSKNRELSTNSIDAALDLLIQAEDFACNENTLTMSSHLHSLYWLLHSFPKLTETVRRCVELLIIWCKNDKIRKRIVNNLFFVPLCGFLSDELANEYKMKLLKLIDQLSVDIKLMFLPENIHKTLETLAKWVVTEKGPVSNLSLQILVNMSYKNDNVRFALCNSLCMKNLTKFCLNEINHDVTANKLMIILHKNETPLPSKILKSLTYELIYEGIQRGNVKQLRDKIDLFFELRCGITDGIKLLNAEEFDFENKFIKYLEDTKRDTVIGAQLVSETLRFLRLLIIHQPNILPAFLTTPRLYRAALAWCSSAHGDLICNIDCAQIEAIMLLLTLIEKSSDSDENTKALISELEKGWAVFKDLIGTGAGLVSIEKTEDNGSLALNTALVRLMRACIKKSKLKAKVVQLFETLDLSHFFNTNITYNNSTTPTSFSNMDNSLNTARNNINNGIYYPEQRMLVVYTAALMVDVCQHAVTCQENVAQFMAHAQLHRILAQVLLAKNDEEDQEIKYTVLTIVQSGLMPLSDFNNALIETPVLDSKFEATSQNFLPRGNTTLSSSTTHKRKLDEIFLQFESAVHTGKLDEFTEEIILLYSSRIAHAENSEKIAQDNLAMQYRTSAQMQQKFEQYNVERDSINRLLVMREQSLKIFKEKITTMELAISEKSKHIEGIEEQYRMIENKFKTGLKDIDQLKNDLKRSDLENDKLKKQNEEDCKKHKRNLKKLETENAKQLSENDKLKETFEKTQVTLQELNEELNKKNQLCIQRSNALLEMRKEKESLEGKLSTIESNFDSLKKLFK